MTMQTQMVLSTGDQVVSVLRGGFSEVGILNSAAGGRRVVKRIRDDILKAGGDRIVGQFIRECQVWSDDLKNAPYVAQALLAFNQLDSLGPVLFIEYVDGLSLAHLIAGERRLAIAQTVRIGHHIGQALAYAHARRIQHRDLKPTNILINRNNETRVIDWGLAPAVGGASLDALSPDYSSSQRRAQADLNDPRDDIYALGVILHKCLTGELPSPIPNADSVRHALRAAEPMLPDALLDLAVSMLAYHPEDRPTAVQAVELFGRLAGSADLEKREILRPFCPSCRFVSVGKPRECPVCLTPMRRRVERPVREGMIRIPAGTFTQGVTSAQATHALDAASMDRSEKTIAQLTSESKTVFLPSFDIDEFPVTNSEFAEFCAAVNYPKPERLAGDEKVHPTHPVVHVAWKDALCYALWAGKRLPSSLEWEKAARGDGDTRPYPWGATWDPERCNHSGHLEWKGTTPVDRFTSGASDGRSPFGVADMTGNVGEWMSEGNRYGTRGVRGGAWNRSCAVYGIVTLQMEADVDFHDEAHGFRCAADIVYDEIACAGEER